MGMLNFLKNGHRAFLTPLMDRCESVAFAVWTADYAVASLFDSFHFLVIFLTYSSGEFYSMTLRM